MSTPMFPPAVSNLRLLHQGKTRDTFAPKSPNQLLVVATDRLSTHNIIHRSLVPGKGEVLTALTIFWIKRLLEPRSLPHHLVAYGKEIYKYLPEPPSEYPKNLHHRAIIVQKLDMIPVEFIWRAYLAGSLYKEYVEGRNPYYEDPLPPGLSLMAPFDPPLFTPTEKSRDDKPMNATLVANQYPEATGLTGQVYTLIRRFLNTSCGLEGVDTKLECGFDPATGVVKIADEIVTPDSSRVCELGEIREGENPPWYDKQIARDEAERMWGNDPKKPLRFKASLTERLSHNYESLIEKATDLSLQEFQALWLN